MLAWIDVETTGLVPREGHLLEVAVVVTDDNLVEMAHKSLVIALMGETIDRMKMDDVVYRMHVTNGLLAEVRTSGMRRYEAEDVLVEFAKATCGDETSKIPLAGSTIGFDRAWLKEHLPKFEALFGYRSVDVSSFTEMAKRWAPSLYEKRPKAAAAHRALADVRESLAYLKFYRESGFIGGSP